MQDMSWTADTLQHRAQQRLCHMHSAHLSCLHMGHVCAVRTGALAAGSEKRVSQAAQACTPTRSMCKQCRAAVGHRHDNSQTQRRHTGRPMEPGPDGTAGPGLGCEAGDPAAHKQGLAEHLPVPQRQPSSCSPCLQDPSRCCCHKALHRQMPECIPLQQQADSQQQRAAESLRQQPRAEGLVLPPPPIELRLVRCS